MSGEVGGNIAGAELNLGQGQAQALEWGVYLALASQGTDQGLEGPQGASRAHAQLTYTLSQELPTATTTPNNSLLFDKMGHKG